jgi:hypothetical protein
MNTNLWNKGWHEPSDEEIERDVSELRRLLEGVEGPKEPHPAYYQNFLVRVRGRIDEERFRRKRLVPSTIWASLSAAAVVVALVVGGVFSPSVPGSGSGSVAQNPGVSKGAAEHLFPASTPSGDLAANDPLYADQGLQSLVLSKNDVKMLDAIMTDDDNAVFNAMVDSDGL